MLPSSIHRLLYNLPRLAGPWLPGVQARGPAYDPVGAPCLYLTFDDGPDPAHDALLDRLDHYRARATFFFLGTRAAEHPESVQATALAGHSIGVHGWTHDDPWRTSQSSLVEGFSRTASVVESLTGRAVRDVRPPYGHITPALLWWCRRTGRRLVLWDLMPGDFTVSAAPEAVAHRIVERARPGSVIVLHEGGAAGDVARSALDHALPALRAAGWCFAAL